MAALHATAQVGGGGGSVLVLGGKGEQEQSDRCVLRAQAGANCGAVRTSRATVSKASKVQG